MAITKIHAIKSTLGKALAYIENPDKTDGQMLVSGYNCEPQTASIDFEMTAVLAHKARNLKRKRSTNLAYHLIQSFSPEDAVTPEQAHELGKKLAFEYTGGKYEYVVATHIDKGHIHNHIMINAVSFYDYKKLRTVPYRTARQIRDISDRLCMEAHLSVIDDPQKIGQLYPENAGKKKSVSNRTEIRKRLNFCLERATDYVINEEQAATVRRIFNLYAEGHGETTVAKMLIEENRKDGGGGLSWTASKVSRVLRKPTYKGYMTYNKSHIDDFLSHNRINHSEEDFVLVKGNFEPIVSEALWETCNQIRSKRAAFVKGKDGRAHKFGVSFPQNKWTKILFCDCGMRFQIEGYDKTANGGKNMRLICARSKMFKKKDAARALNGIPCPAPYASEWKLELMAREVFRTVWKENAEDILGLLRMLDANLNTTGTPNDGNQLENKLSALNEELDDLVSQRASRSITMDDFLSRSTEINNEIINVEGLLQSSIQEQRPKARLDMHSIEAALSDDASFPDGKIEPGFLDRYANRIVKSNNRYIWMLQLVNVQQIMPIQSERQPIAMVTYKSGVPYDIEQEQTGKQDKESAGPDCATICRPQDFFLNMSRTKRKRKLVEWLESCQENQVNVLDEKIPLLSFAVDFVTAYEYQKARGIKIHPGLWKDMRVDIFLVKKEN